MLKGPAIVNEHPETGNVLCWRRLLAAFVSISDSLDPSFITQGT